MNRIPLAFYFTLLIFSLGGNGAQTIGTNDDQMLLTKRSTNGPARDEWLHENREDQHNIPPTEPMFLTIIAISKKVGGILVVGLFLTIFRQLRTHLSVAFSGGRLPPSLALLSLPPRVIIRIRATHSSA